MSQYIKQIEVNQNGQTQRYYLGDPDVDQKIQKVKQDIAGTIKKIEEVVEEIGYLDPNGYDYVNMGSAGLWATCNVGASKPEDIGLYFAWGETTGYKDAADKEGEFTWNSYKLCNGSSSTMTKYCTSSSYGIVDNKTILELEDDAAYINMGGSWRMPTEEEFQKLYNACTTTWTTQNGVIGRLFKLKTDSSKQLFFPAAGYAGSFMNFVGSYGYYWSSSLYTHYNHEALFLCFDNSHIGPLSSKYRYIGCSVRGILAPKPSKYHSKDEFSTDWKVLNSANVITITNWEHIQSIIIDGVNYYPNTTDVVTTKTGDLSYTLIPENGYEYRNGNTGIITIPSNEVDVVFNPQSPTPKPVQIRINFTEGIDKIIFNKKEYTETTVVTVPYSTVPIAYYTTPSENYSIRGLGQGRIIPTNYQQGYDISPIASTIEYRITIGEGVERIEFDRCYYYETTTVYKPYDATESYTWKVKIAPGYYISKTSGTVYRKDYTSGYDIAPIALIPTLNIQVNEGVEKIIINDTDEYTESKIISVPYQSEITYKTTLEEGYEFKTPSIKWEVQTGTWNETSESNAFDNKRFTCVSPGASSTTKIRCTFSNMPFITFTYRSDAQSTYDYLSVGKLDTVLSTYGTSTNNYVDYTYGRQNAWRSYTFNVDGEEHFVEFIFGKNASTDIQPDNAQVYVSGIKSFERGSINATETKEYILSPKVES